MICRERRDQGRKMKRFEQAGHRGVSNAHGGSLSASDRISCGYVEARLLHRGLISSVTLVIEGATEAESSIKFRRTFRKGNPQS